MNAYYDFERKGTMASYVAERESLYEDSTVSAEMVLPDSALTWHLLQKAHITKGQRRIIFAQVGGNYSRYTEIKTVLLKVRSYDESYTTMWSGTDSSGFSLSQPVWRAWNGQQD